MEIIARIAIERMTSINEKPALFCFLLIRHPFLLYLSDHYPAL